MSEIKESETCCACLRLKFSSSYYRCDQQSPCLPCMMQSLLRKLMPVAKERIVRIHDCHLDVYSPGEGQFLSRQLDSIDFHNVKYGMKRRSITIECRRRGTGAPFSVLCIARDEREAKEWLETLKSSLQDLKRGHSVIDEILDFYYSI